MIEQHARLNPEDIASLLEISHRIVSMWFWAERLTGQLNVDSGEWTTTHDELVQFLEGHDKQDLLERLKEKTVCD